MKKIVKFAMVLLAAASIVGCAEEENIGNKGNAYLEVTANNIAGVWSLVSYDNGVELAENSYYYIEFIRKDCEFVSYDNLESMEMQKRSGEFDIYTDGAAIIRGIYDFGQGDWEHQYYVRNLTATEMVWVAVDDSTNVKVYTRVELPEWIDKEQ